MSQVLPLPSHSHQQQRYLWYNLIVGLDGIAPPLATYQIAFLLLKDSPKGTPGATRTLIIVFL